MAVATVTEAADAELRDDSITRARVVKEGRRSRSDLADALCWATLATLANDQSPSMRTNCRNIYKDTYTEENGRGIRPVFRQLRPHESRPGQHDAHAQQDGPKDGARLEYRNCHKQRDKAVYGHPGRHGHPSKTRSSKDTQSEPEKQSS